MQHPSRPSPPVESATLRPALGNRQMSMIAIGGVIGAGLFVGSGSAIKQAGPAVLVAYTAIGVLVILVMRMLAELAVAQPDSGSFSSYASRDLGPWAGLSVGWLYAYQWCVTVGFEAVVGAAITHQLLPSIPTWLAALVLMVALISVNFARVEFFGTFEFWFAMIKVAAIVAFLLLGLAAILGAVPGTPAPGASNLTGQGGFAPEGWLTVLQASLIVFFSFFGTEVVTIAAGEAKDPARAVRRGINSVVWRILLFYIGSIALVVVLLPWNSTAVTESPYSAVLDHLGIPYAGTVMNFIVLTAVLSCLNSGIYASSRMLHSLAKRGEAPRLLTRTMRSGVPAPAIIAASSVGLVTVVANYFLPTAAVYQFLLDSSGSVAVIVYLAIVVTHLRGRARLDRGGFENRRVKMWAYPYLDILALVGLLAVIGGMAVSGGSRRSLMLTLLVTAITVVAGFIHQRVRPRGDSSGSRPAPEDAAVPAP
ncbi:amino acid permease [Streptomyces sp. NPDC019443]|uniref:amino acid permease n=1 Tax=Streptomyces sp. NPDC019443 TaxID=3365061 RepID=UPI00378D589F